MKFKPRVKRVTTAASLSVAIMTALLVTSASTPLVAKSPKDPGDALIRQKNDATCGPAAVATLLTFYFDVPTTEEEVVKLSGLGRDGVSLNGLAKACRAKGFEARGYLMTLQQLLDEVSGSGAPVIVDFVEPSYHFALVVGAAGDFILVSDPARGNVSIHREDFMRRWGRTTLVVKSQRPPARDLIEKRKRAAAMRLGTLNEASSPTSFSHF
ncbi:MAG: C39 family peptidase [Acidobacteriota bacterium]|nr:C39 family peptidase [Acidobacteriota bacterium]